MLKLKLNQLLFQVVGNVVSEECGEHEEYISCGSACQATCDEPIISSCIEICVPGCFCEEDYIREKEDGKCIRRSECCHR